MPLECNLLRGAGRPPAEPAPQAPQLRQTVGLRATLSHKEMFVGQPKQPLLAASNHALESALFRAIVGRLRPSSQRGSSLYQQIMRPRTQHDRLMRDMRRQRHAGGRPPVRRKCPWCKRTLTGREWLTHEHQCPSLYH